MTTRYLYEFTCDNCMRALQVRRGGSVDNLRSAKRHAREQGWAFGKWRATCDRCNPRGDDAGVRR